MAEASTQGRSQARSKLGPRSGVWKHFTRFTDEDGQAKAECEALPPGARRRHQKKRHEQPVGALETARATGRNRRRTSAIYIQHHHCLALKKRPAETWLGYDSSVVEDDYLRSFLRRLNPEFKVPSRLAIEEMCDAIFDETRKDLFSRLNDVPGRVSLAVGTVRTIQGETPYTACHFIDDEWNLHKVIMDAYADLPFPDYHGPLLGVLGVSTNPNRDWPEMSIEIVIDGFSEREVLDNLFMMVWEIKGDHIHRELRNRIEENQINTNPNRRELVICTTYMDNVIHSIARLLIVDVGFRDNMNCALEDLRLTRQERHQLLSQLGLDYHLWAYDELWYSEYCSLEVLRKKGPTLTDTNSVFAELLCMLWGEIYRAIQRISSPNCPTSSNLCLVELFKLREVFKYQLKRTIAYNVSNGFLDSKDVADVLSEAMVDLDKAIQHSYLVWSIPLVLDPRYKLAYIKSIFQTAFGSEAADYISEVTGHINELYSDYVEDDGSAIAVAVGSTDPLRAAWDEHRRAEAQTDLDRYLKDEPVLDPAEGFDILSW